MSQQEDVVDELSLLRERIAGITDSLVSTADGMLVASDSTGIHPESVAALGSVALGLAKRTAATVGLGELREVVTHGQSGYVVIYAIGENAVLILLGDEGLNLVALHAQSRQTVDKLAKLLNIPQA